MGESDSSGISSPTNGQGKKYLRRKDYFMNLAVLESMRSKDPNRQVGACIVSSDFQIVGLGYNRMPLGCNKNEFSWEKNKGDKLNNKLTYVCHAEMNAIINKKVMDLKDCTMYVTLFPCYDCAKIIIKSGIKKIVYIIYKKKYADSKCILNIANVNFEQYSGKIYIELPEK